MLTYPSEFANVAEFPMFSYKAFKYKNVSVSESKDIIQPYSYLREKGKIIFGLDKLRHGDWSIEFKSPIMLIGYKRPDNTYIFVNYDLMLWGLGDTLVEALNDFKETFLNVLWTYRESKLDEEAKSYLKKFNQLIKNESYPRPRSNKVT